MLIMKIELLPFGNKKKSKVLYKLVIVNDNTGSEEIGNYKFSMFLPYLYDNDVYKTGIIKGFPRISKSALYLLYLILKKIFKE